MIIFLGWS